MSNQTIGADSNNENDTNDTNSNGGSIAAIYSNNVNRSGHNHMPIKTELTTSNQPDIAAAVLLAIVKDGRYLSSLVQLLSRAISPWLRSSPEMERHDTVNVNEDDQSNEVFSTIKPELELIAGLTHFFLTIFYRGRTLGMEYVGLEYYTNDKLTSRDPNQSFLKREGLSALIVQKLGSSHAKVIAFAFFYVVTPYLVRRSGRGGWDNLRSLFERFFRRDSATGRGYASAQMRSNNELLRGVERRRVYEEQRKAMLERIRALERQQQEEETDINQHQSDDSQELQQLSTQISHADDEQTQNNPNTSRSTRTSMSSKSFYRLYIKKISERTAKLIWTVLKSLATIEEQELDESTNVQAIPTPTEDDGSSSNANNYFIATLKWVLRLHLALFYLNGRYPSILTHRFLSLRLRNESPENLLSIHQHHNSTRPSYRILGFLLVLQNTALLCKGTATVIMDAFYKMQSYQDTRRQRLRNRIFMPGRNEGMELEEHISQVDDHEDSFLQSVERIVPSLASTESSSVNQSSIIINSANNSENTSRMTCPLCMSERVSPAIAPCGHVFCWKCIQHWVTNVRPECPLCRSQCLPQSVIALWNWN